MRKSRMTLLLSGIVGVVLAYGLLTRALSTGSYWQYLGVLILLVLSVKILVRAFKNR